MKREKLFGILLSLVMVLGMLSGISSKAIAIDYASDSRDYWVNTVCVGPDCPTINLTFSEDGTKLKKIELYGNYTNADNTDYEWTGTGFGIDTNGTRYKNAYLFKNHLDGEDGAEIFLNEAYGTLWSFRASDWYNKDNKSKVYLYKNRGNTQRLEASFDVTDEQNEQLNPNQTYYVNFILAALWGKNARWGTLTAVPFKISESQNHRYSAIFNFNGHGNNFTLPIISGESVKVAASTSHHDYEKYSDDTKNAIQNWSSLVTSPTDTGYVFNGWYTDAAFTALANFNTKITDNVTYYAK